MDSAPVLFGLAVAGIFFVVVVFVFNVETEKDQISHHFETRNCWIINLNFHNVEGKHHRVYDVTFVEPDYKMYRIQCKTGRGHRLWWSEKRFLRTVTPEKLEELLNQREDSEVEDSLDNRSAKEKLVDSLNSGYTFERRHALKQVATLDDVDDVIEQIVRTIADSDEDMAVRQDAKELITQLRTNQ